MNEYYFDIIRDALSRNGFRKTNAAHVLYLMRVEFGTLDHLSRERIDSVACECAFELMYATPEDLEMIDDACVAEYLVFI